MMDEPYYRDESVCLWLGDALSVLRDMPRSSVNCVVTSPPYYGLRDYGVDGQIGLEADPDEYTERLKAVFHEAAEVLKPDGTLWIVLGDSYAGSSKGRRADGTRGPTVGKQAYDRGARTGRLNGPCKAGRRKSLLGIPWRVAFALMDDGWILRNDVVWHKRNAMPSSARDRLTIKHEDLFLLVRGQHYWFDLDAIKTPATKQPKAAQARGGKPTLAMANPGDVWNIPNRTFKDAHFATFPERLPETCIRAGCRPGGVVLDPFSGSGTTGMAALKTGRRYVGIDISRDYLDLSLHTRLAQMQASNAKRRGESHAPDGGPRGR